MSVDWDWTRVVIDHVHIRVQDAAASVAFYKAVLEPLGIPAVWEAERGAQLANLVVTDDEPTTSGPVHIAFVADSREQVDAFHRAGIEAGARDNGAPGVREQYSSDDGGRYYAAFLLDPDGNNVEAVRREFDCLAPLRAEALGDVREPHAFAAAVSSYRPPTASSTGSRSARRRASRGSSARGRGRAGRRDRAPARTRTPPSRPGRRGRSRRGPGRRRTPRSSRCR